MKKIVSIILLLIFLFNVGGYYIVFWGLRFQADQQLTDRLDAGQYQRNEIILLKIPIALPYPIQQQGFERIEGNFDHNGEVFKLVKQKLENDTLYISCIRDHRVEQLESSLSEYVTLTHALPGTTKKAMNFLSKLVKDFSSQEGITIFHSNGYTLTAIFGEFKDSFCSPVLSIQAPPPKV